MAANITKKPSLFANLLLASVSAISLTTSALAGTLATGVTRKNVDKVGVLQRMTLQLTNVVITVTDSGGAAGGQGSVDIFTFPLGGVAIQAVTSNVAVTESGGIGNSATIVMSLGTAAAGAGDATLSGTEANIIPSTSVVLSSSAGSFVGMLAAPVNLDGHTTAITIKANAAAADSDVSAGATLTLNGTVDVWFVHLTDWA